MLTLLTPNEKKEISVNNLIKIGLVLMNPHSVFRLNSTPYKKRDENNNSFTFFSAHFPGLRYGHHL